ncbi:unnamed protein product, partial [Discosporangium mesarthrocarpum]
MCNYKRVKDFMVVLHLLLPLIDDMLEEVGGATAYSAFDLQSSFWQYAIEEDSIPIIAITAQENLFKWLTLMPQGTSGSLGWFSRMVQIVIDGLAHIKLLFDDWMAAIPTVLQHVTDLCALLERFKKHDLKIGASVSRLGANEIN